jgi:hypothetical protein
MRDSLRSKISVEGRPQRRGDHGHLRARAQQQRALARRNVAAAHHQARLAADIEKDWQVVHRVLLPQANFNCEAGSM